MSRRMVGLVIVKLLALMRLDEIAFCIICNL